LLLSGGLTSERVVSEFERLTYRLTGVDSGHERRLVTFVNDLERILFTRLPENQVYEMAAVLAGAQAVFDELSKYLIMGSCGLPSTRLDPVMPIAPPTAPTAPTETTETALPKTERSPVPGRAVLGII